MGILASQSIKVSCVLRKDLQIFIRNANVYLFTLFVCAYLLGGRDANGIYIQFTLKSW